MRKAKLGIIGIAAVVALLAGQDKPAAAPEAGARPKSFVRMDLLVKPARELAPPRRGIFAPSAVDDVTAAEVADDAGSLAIPLAGGRDVGRVAVDSGPPAVESSVFASLSLRYIGFVKSARAIVGLVIVQGQAMAVAAGDTVADWFQVGAISPKEIEVIGSDGSKRTFPLEGEEE